MTSGEVIFNNVEEIVHFVNQAEKIRWDVDVCLGSCIVDGNPLGVIGASVQAKT